MADETNTPVETKVETGKVAAEAAAVETAKDAAPKAAKAAKASRRTATAEKAAKKTTRRAKQPRRARRTERKPAETVSAKERIEDVNTNTNNWFAAFGAPTATPFQSFFAEAGNRSQDAVRRSQKTAEELADLTRENIEALAETGRIAAEGARSIGEDFVETSRESIERTADAVRLMTEAKSATEFVQLQSEFARGAFDRMVNESSRLTESFVKLAGEAIQPISNRASLNAERINQLVA